MSALYIHIPFCEKKCFYCSFVVAVAQEHRMDAYLDCLIKEMSRYRGETLTSIYIGGGTPTMLNDAQLKRLLEFVRRNFVCDRKAEFTVEANPEGVSFDKARLLLEQGVNRISLGIQSFHDPYLKFLGRCHDARMAMETFAVFRKAGFENVNVDLMYSFPGQTLEDIERDVQKMIQLQSEHVSLYTLTVDPHSRFYAKNLSETDNRLQAQQYQFVIDALTDAGIKQYEVSNFSKSGRESQHNLTYWTGGNYIGIGVGAHAQRDGERRWNVSRLNEYIQCLENDGDPTENFEKFSPDQRLMEIFLLGLRMNAGVDAQQLQRKIGCVFADDKLAMIATLVEGGFLQEDQQRIRATDKGRLVLDEIAVRLI